MKLPDLYVRDDPSLPDDLFRGRVIEFLAHGCRWWSVTDRRLGDESGLASLADAVHVVGGLIILETTDPDMALHPPACFDGIDIDGTPRKIRRARSVIGSDRVLITSSRTWSVMEEPERRLIDVVRSPKPLSAVPSGTIVVLEPGSPSGRRCRSVSTLTHCG